MKKYLILLLACLLCSCGASDKLSLGRESPIPLHFDSYTAVEQPKQGEKYHPINFEKVKAIWISYIELAPIISKGEAVFKTEFLKMCKNCQTLGINTLYVHVRTFSDSFYPSELYPYSKAFGGITFDALKIMLEAAHSFGLSFHAWINPLRCETQSALPQLSRCVINEWLDNKEEYPQYVVYVESTSHYWLDPAAEEVRKLIADGAAEIVRNYQVDGVHIDDYFYPTTDKSFDDVLYERSASGKTLTEWRTDNCSEMVSGIYRAVKAVNSEVEFGVSPQGNIANNYNYLYADVKRWCREDGFADYITPQLYVGFDHPYLPFVKAFDEWAEICRGQKRKLIIGLGAYKVNSEEEFIKNEGIIARQAERSLNMTNGAAIFSYNSLFGSERGLKEEKIIAELFNFCGL